MFCLEYQQVYHVLAVMEYVNIVYRKSVVALKLRYLNTIVKFLQFKRTGGSLLFIDVRFFISVVSVGINLNDVKVGFTLKGKPFY